MKTNLKTALILSIIISLLLNSIFLISVFYNRDDPPRYLPVFDIQKTCFGMISNFALTFILFIINFSIFRLKMQMYLVITVNIILILTVTYFISTFMSELQVNLFHFERHPRGAKMFSRGVLSRDLAIAVVVMLSSHLIQILQKQQKIELEKEALHAEYMRSRYEALKNQVDPHFLFNSLNTLSSLVKIDSDRAQEYIQQLSFVLRYTLRSDEVITVRDELEFTKAYSSLMQIRYANILKVEYGIDASYLDHMIIPLSLQTLVENAIKHNIVSNRQPLNIKIEASGEYITVSNPIQPKLEQERTGGIGLVNLAERYRLMMNSEIIINRTENVFEVSVPVFTIHEWNTRQ
ncbi:MAG: histidine kinase [Prevotellaceae bacterium]|jgi:sensor histidine kinase YesM|nr:histidine kinase [Prevotellaceae bacterium]